MKAGNRIWDVFLEAIDAEVYWGYVWAKSEESAKRKFASYASADGLSPEELGRFRFVETQEFVLDDIF